ncbi:MAG: sulfotransferase [Candidatus Thiodiazotropha sp. (ex Epidulcina cf. delphinae)]|nr:sulfotransferase [Candidatus Thiodiazotropha sp. (ex Epidulcina cf. delphinae)]
MSYSILGIQNLENDQIQGFHLDSPSRGLSDSSDQLLVAGWIASQDESVSYLEIWDNSRNTSCCIHTFSLDVDRPDVVNHLYGSNIDQRCGFSTNLTLLGLLSNTLLSLRAHTISGKKISLCEIKLHRTPTSTNFHPKIQPIIITTLGRSGSTWLMQLLARHPSIIVANQHPYETFVLEYWLHLVSHQLHSPYTFLTPVDQQRFKRDFLCNEQRRSWFHNEYHLQALAFCQQAIDGYYRQVGVEQNVTSVSYFAEKIPYYSGKKSTTWRQLSSVVRELYPSAKEIILVRDFRDMVLSAFHFGARNGAYIDIENELPTAYLNVSNEVNEFSEYYRRHRDDTLLVRYEDLLLDTPSILRKIFVYLSIPSDEIILEDMTRDKYKVAEQHRQHITSKSVTKSVQRWKHELAPQLQDKYTEAFRSNLDLFGYD